MTDDELIRWVAEDVLGWRRSTMPDVWLSGNDGVHAIRGTDHLTGWEGFGGAVAEIERRGWQWGISDGGSSTARVVVYSTVVRRQRAVDGGYALAAWRALHATIEATKEATDA